MKSYILGEQGSSWDVDGIQLCWDIGINYNQGVIPSNPTDINISNSSLAENQPIGTFIGLLTATDPDTQNGFTYTVSDNQNFRISQDSLYSNVIFDFESQSSYSIDITVTDPDSQSYSKSFNITITDIDENQTVTALPNNILNQEFILFPNPATESIRIEGFTNQNFSFEILTVLGEVVKKYNSPQNKYDVSDLPSGIYVVVIRYENEIVETIKFIIN